MYTNEEQARLFALAQTLLTTNDLSPEETVKGLSEVIRFADRQYYIESNSPLTDADYDALFARLKALEEAHPELVTDDSPTRRVAYGISERLPTVAHLVPMLSLDNTYNAEDLRDWAARCAKAVSDVAIRYCVEPKYDGAGISLIYEHNKLSRGATRGDGIQGEEITANVRLIKALPLSAPFGSAAQIEIRGEVVIRKDAFAAVNAQRAAEGLPPLANPRNAASGSLRILDMAEVAKRRLSAILYHVSWHSEASGKEAKALASHFETMNWLHELGFPTPVKEMAVYDDIEGVIAHCAAFEAKRDDLPYEVDGLVIKVDNIALQERLGMTTHHPRWAVAYKFAARQATTKLIDVEFQVGRTGSVTPVAKIEPVNIGGATITSVSLFNADIVREKDIRKGDTVLVERAGDVIPYIVRSLPELRNGSEKEIEFPEKCPVCGDPLEKPEEEAVWRCVNINCRAQVLERLIHYCSKDAMDIRGLGEGILNRFFEQNILTTIPQIYALDYAQIAALGGFGERSIANLQASVEASKTQPLARLIFGLGIRHVGETTAKVLANSVTHIESFYERAKEDLMQLQDVGPKVADSVALFFASEDNRNTIKALAEAGVNMVNEHKQTQTSGAFSGKTFLFTGTLSQLKRSEAEAKAEALGGTILSGVSSKLNYLIVGEDAGSKLEKAKKLGSVNILTEEEFLKMLQSENQA